MVDLLVSADLGGHQQGTGRDSCHYRIKIPHICRSNNPQLKDSKDMRPKVHRGGISAWILLNLRLRVETDYPRICGTERRAFAPRTWIEAGMSLTGEKPLLLTPGMLPSRPLVPQERVLLDMFGRIDRPSYPSRTSKISILHLNQLPMHRR